MRRHARHATRKSRSQHACRQTTMLAARKITAHLTTDVTLRHASAVAAPSQHYAARAASGIRHRQHARSRRSEAAGTMCRFRPARQPQEALLLRKREAMVGKVFIGGQAAIDDKPRRARKAYLIVFTYRKIIWLAALMLASDKRAAPPNSFRWITHISAGIGTTLPPTATGAGAPATTARQHFALP